MFWDGYRAQQWARDGRLSFIQPRIFIADVWKHWFGNHACCLEHNATCKFTLTSVYLVLHFLLRSSKYCVKHLINKLSEARFPLSVTVSPGHGWRTYQDLSGPVSCLRCKLYLVAFPLLPSHFNCCRWICGKEKDLSRWPAAEPHLWLWTREASSISRHVHLNPTCISHLFELLKVIEMYTS